LRPGGFAMPGFGHRIKTRIDLRPSLSRRPFAICRRAGPIDPVASQRFQFATIPEVKQLIFSSNHRRIVAMARQHRTGAFWGPHFRGKSRSVPPGTQERNRRSRLEPAPMEPNFVPLAMLTERSSPRKRAKLCRLYHPSRPSLFLQKSLFSLKVSHPLRKGRQFLTVIRLARHPSENRD